MASSSFHTTLFDYLRIVFHRIHWIVVLISLALITGWGWAELVMPKQYSSRMTIMVWSRDMDNPLVRRMIQPAPLGEIINTIRNKLRRDDRLRLMTCNLRFAVKEDYWREYLEPSLVDEEGLMPEPIDLMHEEIQKSWPREYTLQPENPIYAKMGRVLADGWLIVPIHVATIDTVQIDLAHIASQMDTQSLARVLVEEVAIEDSALESDRTLKDRALQNMVIRSVERGTDDRYISALQKQLLPADPNASYVKIRAAAVKALALKLEQEQAMKGGGRFTPHGAREILKELYSVKHLMEVGLYTAADDYVQGDDMRYWVTKLKNGLSVSAVRGSLMQFGYSETLHRLYRPFVREDGQNQIAHLVLEVAYAIIEAEFRTAERVLWDDALDLVEQRKDDLQKELDRINQELHNYEKLTNLQMSWLDSSLVEPATVPGAPQSYWTDQFSGLLRPSVHIQRINKHIDELVEIDKQIAQLEEEAEKLKKQIANPEQRYIEVRRLHSRRDPAEVVSLRGQLVLKQYQMRKMLLHNTMQHPQVQALQNEIDEMQAALDRYRPASTAEEVERTQNPQLAQWKGALASIEREIKGLGGRRRQIVKIIEQEKKKAERAIREQRTFEDLRVQQKDIRGKLNAIQQQEETLQAKREMSSRFDVQFQVHTDSLRPVRPDSPNVNLMQLMAVVIGVVASGCVVFLLEYTDHSIKTIEDARRHFGLPVIGTIPEFNFEQMERISKLLPRALRLNRSPRRESYPLPLDVKEPLPARERERLRSAKPLQRMIMTLVLLTLLVIGGWVLSRQLYGEGDTAAEKGGGSGKTEERMDEFGMGEDDSVDEDAEADGEAESE